MIKLPKFKATVSLISVMSEKLEDYSEALAISHEVKREGAKALAKAEAEVELDEIKSEILEIHKSRKSFSQEENAILEAYMS